MVFRRCPKCRNTTDDRYGFCIRCGYEFPDKQENDNIPTPNNETNKHTCANCGFENPEEATFCVKCGMPLMFNQQFKNNNSPFIIKYENLSQKKEEKKEEKKEVEDYKKTSRLVIIIGYIFSLLGGIIGLIFAIYLSTRKDPVARKHGHVQIAIFLIYAIIIAISIGSGMITFENITQMSSVNNLTALKP